MIGPLAVLQDGRRRELEQALFYRTLSGLAHGTGDAVSAERLNELLADEQHHVSRLTARILELGESPHDYRPDVPTVDLQGWLAQAEAREAAEVAWYEGVIPGLDDAVTIGVLREILDSERNHLDALGGKWMPAAPMTETDS